MTELPTRAEVFANCVAPLDSARGSLSEVRDWLRSDWQPVGAALSPEAGEARVAILETLTAAKNLIDTMKSRITEAIDSLPAEPVSAGELVVEPRGLRPGDEIVGIQKYGRSDVVAARSGRIVGVGEHRTGGECIQLRWRDSDPIGHESNWWRGQDYLDESLFHVRRKTQ